MALAICRPLLNSIQHIITWLLLITAELVMHVTGKIVWAVGAAMTTATGKVIRRQCFKRRRLKPSRNRCRRIYAYSTKHRRAKIVTKRPTGPLTQLWAMARQAQPKHRRDATPTARFDSDSFNIAVDNCASTSFTNTLSDFVGKPKQVNQQVRGVGQARIRYMGKVRWKIQDDLGIKHTITLENVAYQPDLPFRLLCPQHWAQSKGDTHGTGCLTLGDKMELFWDHRKHKRTIPLSKSNIGMLQSAPGIKCFATYCMANNMLPEVTTEPHSESNIVSDEESVHETSNQDHITDSEGDDESTDEVTHQQQSLPARQRTTTERLQTDEPSTTKERSIPMQIDFRDSPAGRTIHTNNEYAGTNTAEMLQVHYRLGHISFNKMRHMANTGDLPSKFKHCQLPVCASCSYGKATKRPWRTRAKQQRTIRPVPINQPGDCISVDQLESPTPGFIGQVKGKLTNQRYRAATIFVDHYSRLSYVHLQKSTNAEETLNAKKTFEAYARSHHVQVKHYHADNGRFAENLWRDHIDRTGQTITFCAAEAHFQNGVAERRIRDLMEPARTMILHASIRWKAAMSIALWPYALRMANEVINSAPMVKHQGQTPIERFTGAQVRPQLKHFHTFGCPTYVLNSRLASGGSQPKWLSRSRLGIYIGISPVHAKSVALILNPRTGLVSPQFHIKCDDMFQTVAPDMDNNHSKWKQLAKLSPQLGHSKSKTKRITMPEGAPEQYINKQSATVAEPDTEETLQNQDIETDAMVDERLQQNAPTMDQNQIGIGEQPSDIGEDGAVAGQHPTTAPTGLRRSSRNRTPSRKVLENIETGVVAIPAAYEVANYHLDHDSFDPTAYDDPLAFAASADPDTMYYHQAMAQPDRDKFKEAMQKEIDAHHDNGHWKLIPRTQVPKEHKVLSSVWSMKRKRRLKTREVYRWKARLNVHGGQQEKGVNYWETYAPVVTWISIRLVLILSIMLDWHTKQVDFILAYPQADVETTIYMEIPTGVKLQGGDNKSHVLQLVKNLYGQKQAGRVWNEHLHKGLLDMGFVQSKYDRCVYYKGRTIFLVYVDDGILAGPDKEQVEEILANMQSKYNMTDEGDITDYLGVHITKMEDGRIKLAQPHLIDQLVEDVNFRPNTRPRDTPAQSTTILNKDEDGPPHNAAWHYRSVIGKLNFLEKSTRGEIAYAVHQAARFCQDPKKSHTNAVHHIIRYLRSTRDEGIILDPKDKGFECYADADFVGLWNKETAATDPSTSKSRTGYIIMFAGCPVTWASKLQTEIALSTTEAEFISLSTALREVIPMMHMLQEMCDLGITPNRYKPKVYCKAFEDNSGALEIARMPKMRPRTKHINVKYHHFRRYVENKMIEILPISSEEQLADLWTKPLSSDLFQRFTQLTMGWRPGAPASE